MNNSLIILFKKTSRGISSSSLKKYYPGGLLNYRSIFQYRACTECSIELRLPLSHFYVDFKTVYSHVTY